MNLQEGEKESREFAPVKDGFLLVLDFAGEVEKPIENGQEVTDEDDLPI